MRKTAAKWIRSEADAKAVANGCWYDKRAGDHIIKFFTKFLRHSKGQWAGQPFVPATWQAEDLLMPLFGWKRADGTRRYRMAYIEVPKKNGKSALCSGVALYMLVADGEPGAEIYTAAADKDQAGIIFNVSADMVRASPALTQRLEIIDSRKRIWHRTTNSVFRALSADVPTKEGLNIHGLFFDELHAQRTRRLWDTLRYGGAARRQPLLLSVTTAGFDKQSICWEQHDRAAKILDGTIQDDSFFALIRCANDGADGTEADDWNLPATWHKANPSMGIIFDEESVAEAYREAKDSPPKENTFKRYRLNIWTEQDVRWLQMAKWNACDGAVNPEALKGQACYAGLDMASTTDLSALVLLFPEAGNAVLPFFWVPGDNARKREDRDRAPYVTWTRQGHMEMTEGNVIDYDVIRKRINELGEIYNIREIAIDRWNTVQLQTQLAGDGFEIVPFGQGFQSMGAPTRELERLVLCGGLSHGGHPVLRWNASNVTVEQNAAGFFKPSKSKSTEKIDGIVALIMAIGRAMVRGEARGSVYETRGIKALRVSC